MALRPCSILPRFHGGTVKTSMRLIYRSTPMLHRTNMPLQLSAQDPDVSSLTDYFDLVTILQPSSAASWTDPEAEMSEKGHSKQVYSDQPKIDLAWLPCGAPPQAGYTSEPVSLDLPLNDGATPQRRKASSLHGLSNAAEESLLKAQQQFWCQQLKLHDQIEDIKPLYAKLWLKAIDEEETQVAEKVRLETGAAVKTDEGEAERNDSGEDETEEDGSDDDTEEGSDESELSDGDMDLDAHQGTKWQSASPLDRPSDAAAFEQQRARRDSSASSVLSARDQVFKKLQKILTAKARRKSRRTCNIFLVSPVEGENASLVLPPFSPSEVFGPADVERMKQVRDSPPKCPGPEGLRMLKELVAEIKKVEAASESASIYMGGASMQAEQAPSVTCIRVPCVVKAWHAHVRLEDVTRSRMCAFCSNSEECCQECEDRGLEGIILARIGFQNRFCALYTIRIRARVARASRNYKQRHASGFRSFEDSWATLA
ncbi:unnamed protein product [Symbiodinium sp. CCMP2592]|nr:unnamed protein product [Symbiodinium sp. CCMP2592]